MRLNSDTWRKVIALDMLLVCFSFSVSVVGQMLGAIKETYMLSFTQSSMLVSVQSIGGLVLAILSILYIDIFDKTRILVICGLMLCGLMMVIGIVPPLFIMFVIFALLGLSGGAINALTNPVMARTVPHNPTRFIVFMHMLFSLSSIIAPLVSQSLYMTSGLSGTFLTIGGFALCWAIYAAVVFRKDMVRPVSAQKLSFRYRLNETKSVFLKPGMKQMFFISIMMSAWQMGTIYNVSSYIRELGGSADAGAVALSVLFGGMMVSRLLYSRFADRFSPGRVMMVTNLLAVLAWAGLFIVGSIAAKTVLIGLVAFFCGNNFPVAFAGACQIAPDNSATASGFIIFGYYIAIFAFIPVIGALGDALGLAKAFVVTGAPLLIIIPTAHWLNKYVAAHKPA